MNTHTLRHARVVAGTLILALAMGRAYAAADAKTAADALYKDGVAAYRQQNFEQALAQFRTLEKDYPDCVHSVRAYEYIAQCENKLNDPYAAFEAYQAIWDKHKDFTRLPTITRNQMKIANYLIASQNYKKAIEAYQKILINAPYSDVAPAAQYSLAQAYIGENDYEAAKTELGKVIKNHPTSQLVDDAAYEIGRVSYVQSADAPYDQNATSEAIAAFRRFISDFPSSPKVPEAQRCIRELRGRRAAALQRTAQFYENIQVPKAAELTYRELIEQYPDTAEADEGRTRLAALGGTAVPKALPTQPVPPDAASKTSAPATAPRKAPATPPARIVPHTVPMPVSPQQVEGANREQDARKKKLLQDPETRKELKIALNASAKEDLDRALLAQVLLAEARSGQRLSREEIRKLKEESRQPRTQQPAPTSRATTAPYTRQPDARSLADEAAEPAQPSPASSGARPGTTPGTHLKPVDGLSMSDDTESAPVPDTQPTPSAAVTQLLKDVMVEEPEPAPGDDRAAAAASIEQLKERLETINTTTEPATAIGDNDGAEPARAGSTPSSATETPDPDSSAADQIATETRVRRAQYTESTDPASGSAYSTEDLKREYEPIFYSIKRGDELTQRGLSSDAKSEYSKALDKLLKLKQKAPTWQSEILNFRIEYCRERMKSVQ